MRSSEGKSLDSNQSAGLRKFDGENSSPVYTVVGDFKGDNQFLIGDYYLHAFLYVFFNMYLLRN